MAEALGFMVPAAIAAALISLPAIMVMILLMSAPDAGSRPVMFASGWLGSFAITCTIFLLIADVVDDGDSTDQSRWVSWLLIVLGGALLFLAWRKWQGRPREGAPVETPKWMASIQETKPSRLITLAAIMGGFNPKYLAVVPALIAELSLTPISGIQSVLVIVLFILIASTGLLAPVVAAGTLGDRAQPILDGIRGWLDQYNWLVMMLMLGFFGIKLISDAIVNLG